MLRITRIESEPFHTLSYRTAGPKGKSIRAHLPFYRAEADGLPSSVKALVLTSDLQGRETGPQNQLLGYALADELVALHNKGIIPRPNLIALCGDLYEYPDCHKRGGTGPVDEVFCALSNACDRVVGVLGNHDELARRDTVNAPKKTNQNIGRKVLNNRVRFDDNCFIIVFSFLHFQHVLPPQY